MALYELYRHDLTLYKAESATSDARIPAESVTIDVYREGATAQGAGPGLTITVHDPGAIVAGDTVFIGTATGTIYVVAGITATSIVVTTSATWSDGDRIIPSNNRPLTYTDDAAGETTTFTSQVTTDSNGEAYFYTKSKHVDCVTTDGATLGLVSDLTGVGGRGTVNPMDWGARFDDSTDDAGAFADAIEYLKAIGGGVLELPPGTCRLGSAIAIDTTSNIRIVGAGRGITTVKINHAGIGFDLSAASDITIQSFTLQRISGSADLIEISDSSCSRNTITDMRLIGGGIGIDDHGTDTRIRDLWYTGSGWTSFVRFDAATRPHVTSLIARPTGNWTRGIDIDTGTASVRLTNVDIAPVSTVSSAGGIGCHIRDSAAGTDPRDIVLNGCTFVGGTSTGSSQGIDIDAGQGIQILGGSVLDSARGMTIDGGTAIKVVGTAFVATNYEAIDINAGTHVRISEIDCSDNNMANSGVAAVEIAAGVDDISVNGLTMGQFIRSSGFTGNYAVNIAAGASDRVQVLGIRTDGSGSISGIVNNGSTVQTLDMGHCIGLATSTYGHSSPLAGGFGSVIGVKSITDGSTSTSVQNVHTVILNQSGSVTWLNFTGGTNGQQLTVVNVHAANTADFADAGNFVLGAARTLAQGDVLSLIHSTNLGGVWVERGFSNN